MMTRNSFNVVWLGIFVFLGCFANVSAKEDPYDKLAEELSEAALSLKEPKIAILPFSYVDKRKSNGSAIISERLTTRMVKLKKCKIIERQLLENVISELHLETTGIVDAETTKKLGKVLGVEAIITGTFMDIEDNMIEVNARVIKTETAEVITTSSVEVKKIWTDELPAGAPVRVAAQTAAQQPPAQTPPQQTLSQPAYQPYTPPIARPRPYLDFFLGRGGGTVNLTFENDFYAIRETDLSLDFNGSGTLQNSVYHYKIAFENAQTETSVMPIGLRYVVFGKYWGGGLEFSYYMKHLAKQVTTATYDDASTVRFSFYTNDYLKISVLTLISGDIFLRFSDKMFQPYIGLGIGMTLNSVSSPYIYGFSDSSVWKRPLNSFGVGFLFRVPIGARIVFNDTSSAFIEFRSTTNTFSFDRGISNETDTISMSTGFLLFGIGLRY